ncbi:hypothetical protein F5B18DRAFT_52655 [Nemania serpens]|nr:hypothetical protein F5B18DRAFT_52655 [Nemania serpens]
MWPDGLVRSLISLLPCLSTLPARSLDYISRVWREKRRRMIVLSSHLVVSSESKHSAIREARVVRIRSQLKIQGKIQESLK